ncbi:hypothetical protein LZ24_03124 [Desulfobotulus alkaliphilus]|uniref:N-acetyltransferase domain-containing protein n=1 Tax=Desulfobotulus alkaliphilus TaxID=622671 RepID=A0A562R6W7_9BACT|nr:hypothetical protein [Desulfobotulus alkaliphilus]TWI64787.1 hypothetical protein LZ24_03124 [Desulfobotulus alkaliphilus]
MDLQIRLMQKDDAPGVVELYRAVYGDHYPVASVYDPEAILAAQEAGDFFRVLAILDGRVVGQTAVYRSDPPNRDLYEEGQAIVLKELRNQDIMGKTMGLAHSRIYPEKGLHNLWGEAVCNHVFMQKAGIRLGYVFTGMEIDLMPADAYEMEKSSSGRVSALIGFKVKDSEHRRVHLHPAYADILPSFYEGLSLSRDFVVASSPLTDTQSRLTESLYPDAGVARFTFLELGMDFVDILKKKENEAVDQGCTVIQVFLDLSRPEVVTAIEILRHQAYFLGSALPCWYGNDGILMQKLLHEPNIEGIKVHGERSESILATILKDREATRRD